ncbi:hypothetical protein M9458_056086, partial [Cirrhinus mrigala]
LSQHSQRGNLPLQQLDIDRQTLREGRNAGQPNRDEQQHSWSICCYPPSKRAVNFSPSDQYQAFLSEERIRLCLRLLGLMVSTVSVIPLGLLRMREFQNWTAALHLCPKRHLNRKVMVSVLCMRALRYWKNRLFLESGTLLGAVSMRKVVGEQSAKLMVWGRKHFHSLRATHVPGIMNAGADLLSRGNPRYGEWTLHPQVVGQLWKRFGRAAIDLFASCENSHCPLFFSLARDGAPMGVDALAHSWPNVLLYTFPPLSLIIPTLRRVREYGHSYCHTDCPKLAGESVAGGDNAAPSRPAMASPATQRPPLAGARGDIPPRPGQGCSLGLARKRLNLNATGQFRRRELLQHALLTIRNGTFSSNDVLCFLQELLDKRRAFSTVMVCHVGIDDNTMGRHPLVCRFIRGARRLNRVRRPLIPPWDLSVVLNALVHILSL